MSNAYAYVVRGQQDPGADPYRTLGLEPGASTAEIKRAYRLLAKAFHPDSAGEKAVPRFLAIQAAYEELTTGKVVARPKASRPASAPAAEPWRADPARAQAARERARTARSKRGSSAGPATGASGGSTGDRGGRPSGSRTGTSSSGTRSGRRRDVRKATMGSTSYDEARDPSDATWSGASWYGPSSGEYWIVNPREYADPRKHGPEYQQRARRPLDGDAPEVPAAQFEHARAEAARGEAQRGEEQRGEAARAEASASRPADRAWRATTGSVGSAERPASTWTRARVEPAAGGDPPRYRPGEAAREPDRVEAFGAGSRAWLGGPADDPVRRFGLALVAWPPIGLAAAAAIGEATGCTVYSAACGGSEPLLPWLAQAAILGLLLLLPSIARVLTGGAIAVLFALVPITAFLLAVGASGAPQAGPTMAVLLGGAWLVGVGWSARAFRRRLDAGAAR